MSEVEQEFDKFVARLEQEYTQLRWRAGKKFTFRPPRTIVYEEITGAKLGDESREKTQVELQRYEMQLLHELGHALLRHRDFRTDLERVKMECAAWEKARELSKKYGVEFCEEVSEGQLDSYRDWLHQKSLCKKCGLTRYQTQDGVYHCPGCEY